MENIELKRLPFPYSNYMISEDGKIIKRVKVTSIKQKEYISQHFQPVKGKQYPNGYMCVTLYEKDYKLEDGSIVMVPHFSSDKVHRLVAFTYLPPPMSDKHVWINHVDGNKLNNHYSNLEWTTISQNIQHSFDVLGRKMPTGKDHWMYGRKVPASQRLAMREQKLGDKHPKFKGYYKILGKQFGSAQLCCDYLNSIGYMRKNWYPKAVLNYSKSNKHGFSFIPKTTK